MSVLDLFRLDWEVAVVTGGNRGIGKAIATGLAEAGATVVIAARDAARNDQTATELAALSNPIRAVTTDVTYRRDLIRMRDEVLAEFGHIDILINNAGVGIHGDSLTIDYDKSIIFNNEKQLAFEPIPPHLLEMVRDGGLIPHLEKRRR